jgi:hypothetical protein
MNGRLRAALVLGAALLGGLTSSLALAGPPAPKVEHEPEGTEHRVLVLPLRATGFSKPDHEALERQLSHALAHPRLELIHAELPTNGCDLECRRALASEHEASHLVSATIDGSSREYSVAIEVLTLDEDPTPERIEAECSICGLTELGDQLAAQAAIARNRVLNTPSLASLVVLGQPEGARLSVDGVEVGELPYTGSLAPGEHQLRISARGHYAKLVPITAVAGVEESVRVDLVEKPRARHWQRPVGWTSVGAGLASLGVGLTLLAIDGQAVGRRCQDSSDPYVIDRDGDCRWVHQTRGAGVGVTSLGVGLLAAGTGLLIFDTKQRKQDLERGRTRVSLGIGLTRAHLQVSF